MVSTPGLLKDARARLAELARIEAAPTPVVSVYLDTRWADEHHRDRVRLFLESAIGRARADASGAALADDLRWVEEEGRRLVAQEVAPDARGIALFACAGLGVRDLLPTRVPFEPRFVVGDRPFLAPLAEALQRARPVLVVFVDGERARLVSLDAHGAVDEVTLEHEVPGRHARGGWAQLAQSRYQRHVEVHRDQHLDAVARAAEEAAREHDVERLVLAGEPRALAQLRKRLPSHLAALVDGAVTAAAHEPASALADRASRIVEEQDRARRAGALDHVLTEAAKGGRAVAGAAGVVAAVARGAVDRLYVLAGFADAGRACGACGALAATTDPACRACGAGTAAVDLGAVIVARVLASRGTVEIVDAHPGLEAAGGIAARLRFPL